MTRNNSDWTYDDLREAEVVPSHSGEGVYLVRLGENDYVSVPNTGLTTLALHDDVFDSFDGDGSAFDGDGSTELGSVTVEVDFDADEVVLERGGDTARIPEDKHENVFYAVHDRDMARLTDLFEEHYTPTVRRGVMDWFLPRFRKDDEVRQTDEGWLLNDEVLLRWDGSNEVADPSLDTHVVRGGSTKQQDIGREAYSVSFDLDKPVEATTPAGRMYMLDAVEAEFLVTVGLVLEQNPHHYSDDLWLSIDDSSIDAFTDTKSGIRHGHSKKKHRLRDLGVTTDTIEKLYYNEHDHAGVVELAYREQEFRNAPFGVFERAANDDDGMWQKINDTKENAPVPHEVNESLEAMYGSED